MGKHGQLIVHLFKNKMVNKKRRLIEFLFIIVLTTMLCSLISAVAISLPYHNLNYLKVGPGQTKNVVVGNFQNTGDKDAILDIVLIEGSEIAELTDSNLNSFTVPSGALNVPFHVKVSIPEDAVEGSEYKITIQYKEITVLESTGMITMVESKTISIPVLVEKTEEEPIGISVTWIIVGILVIIILIVIIKFVLKSKETPAK